MSGQKWQKSRFPGIRFYKHKDGRIVNPDAPKPRQKIDCYYAMRYKVKGKSFEEGLGWTSHGWNEEKAAETLAQIKSNIRTGSGPQSLAEMRVLDDQAREQEEQRSTTVQDLADIYLERWAKPRKKSWKEDEKNLNKNVLPVIGTYRIVDITRRDLNGKVLNPIRDRGAEIQANRVLALLRRMFNFAAEQGLLEQSPASHIKGFKESARDRVLSEAEIKALLAGIATSNLYKGSKLALEIILRTAQRPGEVREIEKKDVDLEKGLWIIPAEKSKNGIAQTLLLPPKALELIQQAMAFNSSSPFLIPSPFQDSPISEYGLAQALRIVVRDQAMLKATPHDLRRTAATRISELGFNRLVVDKVLNHKDLTVGGVYDRHSYDKEKLEALEA